MSGIGVIIIFLQIFPFFGHASPKTIPDILMQVGTPLSAINWEAVLLASLTIAIIYLFPRITKVVPSALVALIVVSMVPMFIPMNVPLIGDIPTGLPELQIDQIMGIHLNDLKFIIMPAITLAALGAIDSLLTSVVADNITKTKHNSNKELIGQGLGNMGAALIGGIPGAGATMRTVVNVKSGGKTKLSGVIHGVLLLIILLGAGRYAAQIPLPVLAGILITVGIAIIDYKGFKHLAHIPRADAAIMIIVLLVTVFDDLLQAVGIGMVLATILFMKKMGDASAENTSVESLKVLEKEQPWPDERGIPEHVAEHIYVKHLYGPLFFGFTSKFQELAKGLTGVDVVIFRMERVPFMDQTGLYALEEVILSLRQAGVTVLLTGLQGQPRQQLEKIQIIPSLIDMEYVFEEFSECRTWLINTVRDEPQPGELPAHLANSNGKSSLSKSI
jgi:SulP family sulfate permease